MRMPVMDGAEFLKQVRVGHPETARILLTGYASRQATESAIHEGEFIAASTNRGMTTIS